MHTQTDSRQSNRSTAPRLSLQTCNSLHSTFTISSALADSADAKMLKMPVSLYRLLMAVQLTIQGNWFSTLVYNRECMPLPASYNIHYRGNKLTVELQQDSGLWKYPVPGNYYIG